MSETAIIGLFMAGNLLFLCLGFWMGRISSNQAIPGLKIPFKKPVPFDEYRDDPFEKAMTDPAVERIETIDD